MRAPEARNTATVMGAAAAALLAVSPLLGAPASAEHMALAPGQRAHLGTDGRLLATGMLASAGQTGMTVGSALVRGHLFRSTGGRLEAFSSWAFDLLAADSNCTSDVFVEDQASGRTERVSVATDGGPANGPSWGARLSRDGLYVTFSSKASNLVANDSDGVADRFQRDLETRTTRLLHPLATSASRRTIPPTRPSATPVTP